MNFTVTTYFIIFRFIRRSSVFFESNLILLTQKGIIFLEKEKIFDLKAKNKFIIKNFSNKSNSVTKGIFFSLYLKGFIDNCIFL